MNAAQVDGPTARVVADLRPALAGDIRSDRLHRALYATDASIYQIVPDAVVLPRTVDDIVATVRGCARHGVPVTPRGAGTGLAGGAVNRGVQLDCSRYLNRILDIDPTARTATVQPGVVLDELNAELAPHGLHFAPDVATSSRATIGGMIANNSCGAHSIRYGRTVDHVLSVDVVLSDGSTVTWGAGAGEGRGAGLARDCERVLSRIARDHADEIAARYPKVLRSNGGYGLDRLHIDNGSINPEAVICGSEGTLAVVVGAKLKLSPIPRHKGLVVAHFHDLLESLAATPAILEHDPAAVELIDDMIVRAARSNPALSGRGFPIEGEPRAVLIIELFDEDAATLSDRLQAVAADLASRGLGYARRVMTEPAGQAAVWDVRTRGLGLLMSRPGDRQPYAFVEDTAVAPDRLRDYIERFGAIVAAEGVDEVGYYAHASVGCLHVRPVLNLTQRTGVERMRRIADRVSSLALEFGGTMTGEHGDGLARSCWLEKMYGPRIVGAFRRIKHTFDPDGILNPGKIVDPLPMTEHLRFEFDARRHEPATTTLDFSAHGSMAGLAGMCSGVGQCRQQLVGTMCPSFMATNDEKHTTRARANALRIALSDQGLLADLDDPALDEVMDLCLSCKACRTECPTGVDMARLKSEWLSQRQRRRGVPLRSRLIARSHELAAAAGRVAPLANWIGQQPWIRALADEWLGLDRRMAPPRLARRSFRDWFGGRPGAGGGRRRGGPGSHEAAPPSHRRSAASSPDRTVVLFADTWTNRFTPDVGIAAVRVLESMGYRVIVPPTVCCGRPAISKGVLDVAARLARQNVDILADYARRGVPIIGTEPSCILTLVDELPQLVRSADARAIARHAVTIEAFLAARLELAGASDGADVLSGLVRRSDRALASPPGRPIASSRSRPVLYHGHCHQKALVGTAAAMRVLSAVTGGHAVEINSGCCGMAGSFGHESEHYDIAKAIGQQRLFPAVRDRGEAEIVVSGFSCRCQIEHHTGVRPRHVIELVAEAIGSDG